MKKVILSSLLAGMFLFGTAYAQTPTSAPAAKPAAKKEVVAKSDATKTHKGKGKGKGKKASTKMNKTEAAPQTK